MNTDKIIVYLNLSQQTTLYKREVLLEDICEIECRDKGIKDKIGSIKLYRFPKGGDKKVYKKVFSVVEIISEIMNEKAEVVPVSIGETDCVIEYKPFEEKPDWKGNLKVMLVSILVFFGSAFTIMAFNNDVSIVKVFEKFYYQIVGNSKPEISVIEIAYSIGLSLGIIIFFNHFGMHKLTDDVTPIEVEMNKHTRDTYDTIIDKDKEKEGN